MPWADFCACLKEKVRRDFDNAAQCDNESTNGDEHVEKAQVIDQQLAQLQRMRASIRPAGSLRARRDRSPTASCVRTLNDSVMTFELNSASYKRAPECCPQSSEVHLLYFLDCLLTDRASMLSSERRVVAGVNREVVCTIATDANMHTVEYGMVSFHVLTYAA